MLDQFDPRLDAEFPPVDRRVLRARLAPLLPAGGYLDGAEALRAYESDGLPAYRSLPAAVVLPETLEQVRAILKACAELEVPVVTRGAGTGLSGGALPFPGGVLLVMSKFSKILEIDPVALTARVQPGVRNLAVSEAAAPHGLFYAPDPSSQIACSIGGNVAENAGGVHCLKYGLTVHNILSVQVVTLDGEVLTLGGPAADAAGLDLMALFTGSEGLLGVVTEVLLRLQPLPETTRLILAAFDEVGRAAEAVAAIMAAGVTPAGLEMMDGPALRAAEDFARAGYPKDAAAILLCEIDGQAEDVAEEIERVSALLRESGAAEVRIARDEDERRRFWAGRKGAFPAMGRLAPDYYCIDGTIPRKSLPFVLAEMGRLAEVHGLGVANVFHAGDGNLHPLILYDANLEGDLEKAEALGGAIL
ncbi:MAG: FAD-binding protein, partial [Phenylobacterium sp.]|nr:FAD-binding protein [Phenylobacterium sp.]